MSCHLLTITYLAAQILPGEELRIVRTMALPRASSPEEAEGDRSAAAWQRMSPATVRILDAVRDAQAGRRRAPVPLSGAGVGLAQPGVDAASDFVLAPAEVAAQVEAMLRFNRERANPSLVRSVPTDGDPVASAPPIDDAVLGVIDIHSPAQQMRPQARGRFFGTMAAAPTAASRRTTAVTSSTLPQSLPRDAATTALTTSLRSAPTALAPSLESAEFDADPPTDYLCPIMLTLMTDPVICVGDGHTYSRVGITTWLKAGNHRSPKTNEVMTDTRIVPTHLLRGQILEWAGQHRIDNLPVEDRVLRRRAAASANTPPQARRASPVVVPRADASGTAAIHSPALMRQENVPLDNMGVEMVGLSSGVITAASDSELEDARRSTHAGAIVDDEPTASPSESFTEPSHPEMMSSSDSAILYAAASSAHEVVLTTASEVHQATTPTASPTHETLQSNDAFMDPPASSDGAVYGNSTAQHDGGTSAVTAVLMLPAESMDLGDVRHATLDIETDEQAEAAVGELVTVTPNPVTQPPASPAPASQVAAAPSQAFAGALPFRPLVFFRNALPSSSMLPIARAGDLAGEAAALAAPAASMQTPPSSVSAATDVAENDNSVARVVVGGIEYVFPVPPSSVPDDRTPNDVRALSTGDDGRVAVAA